MAPDRPWPPPSKGPRLGTPAQAAAAHATPATVRIYGRWRYRILPGSAGASEQTWSKHRAGKGLDHHGRGSLGDRPTRSSAITEDPQPRHRAREHAAGAQHRLLSGRHDGGQDRAGPPDAGLPELRPAAAAVGARPRAHRPRHRRRAAGHLPGPAMCIGQHGRALGTCLGILRPLAPVAVVFRRRSSPRHLR